MYKSSPKLVYLLKCGFLVLVAAGCLKIVLLKFQPDEGGGDYELDNFDMFGENSTDSLRDGRFTLEILREDFKTCLMSPFNEIISEAIPSEHSKMHDIDSKMKSSYEMQTQIFKEMSDEKFRDRLNIELHNLEARTTVDERDLKTQKNAVPKSSCSVSMLANFNKLLESLDIKVALIEPSILYCMLLPTYQELLEKKNFNISNFPRSKGIITFGIYQHDVFILEEEESFHNFRKNGFLSQFIRLPPTNWMIKSMPILEFTNFTSHIFYTHKDCSLHLVVFHNRENYLWHAALDRGEKQKSPLKNELQFVDSPGAYEKFDFVPLTTKDSVFAYFYIPSDPHHFLFQILSSQFLECSTSRAADTTVDNLHPKSHPGLSVERFNKRTVAVIRQLKTIFQPLLMNLWIWSGTMLGWYRQCDIIPYTTDVDFAAWASEVQDLDELINKFRHNKYVSIKMRMGLLEEGLEFQLDCFKLRTDIFFLYPLQNGSWCSGHSPKEGYYFRYHYPRFTLCSADLLGEKIQVPCETDKVITTEYGPQWFKPVSSWSYESSPRNRGPNIYWSRQKLKDAYQIY